MDGVTDWVRGVASRSSVGLSPQSLFYAEPRGRRVHWEHQTLNSTAECRRTGFKTYTRAI